MFNVYLSPQVRLQELLKYPSQTKTNNMKVSIRQLLPGPGNDYRSADILFSILTNRKLYNFFFLCCEMKVAPTVNIKYGSFDCLFIGSSGGGVGGGTATP